MFNILNFLYWGYVKSAALFADCIRTELFRDVAAEGKMETMTTGENV